jgi:hypothetical protein
MIASCLATALVASVLVGRVAAPAVLLGMLGPLVAVTVSWALVARAHARNPASVTSLMVAMFLAKMVFFGAWVVVMIRGVGLAPVPFIVSFTAYFLGLYVVEAVLLQRLSRVGTDRSSGQPVG